MISLIKLKLRASIHLRTTERRWKDNPQIWRSYLYYLRLSKAKIGKELLKIIKKRQATT